MSARSAIVTVAFGHSTENLHYTFESFAKRNPGIPLHAFIIGDKLPKQRLECVTYHLVAPSPDFSHPLREIYFRRLELIDQLDADYALVVDSYDVLCLQTLPPFEKILSGSDVAACVEHMAARYVMGQGYTANFLNGGVFFWNIKGSRDIRHEITARGRAHFRTVADDQHCINEVIQTKYYDRLRILPCQYNYRAYINADHPKGWPGPPEVTNLDGVMIYHNGPSIDEQRESLIKLKVRPKAELPPLENDGGPISENEQVIRKLQVWTKPHVLNESVRFRGKIGVMKFVWNHMPTFVRAIPPNVMRRIAKFIGI